MRALGWLRAPRAVAIAAVAAIALLIPASSLSVHNTGAFELDGNAVAANAAPPVGPADDWDRVCFQVTADSRCGTTTPATANAASWTGDVLQGETDPFAGSLNATLFTGGGSKDGRDVSLWAWKDGAGGLPDKDNLLHSFAARYTTNQGEVLYFGSDRYDNSGDAQQGFWFFQNEIKTTGTGSGTFTGLHKEGDLLVVSHFSNGGTTSTITVYKWDASCTKTTGSTTGTCGDANLRILATSNNAKCSSVAANDDFCGIVNPNTITMSWSFTDKSGTPNNQALNGEFYEGGVN